MKRIFCHALAIITLEKTLAAQNPFSGIEFGSSSETVKASARDVSNPQSWEETAYEMKNPPYVLLGEFKPVQCTLTYHNNRLYKANCEFARAQYEAIYTKFVELRQVPKDRKLGKTDKWASWYGEYRDGRFTNILHLYQSGARTVVSYSDETQKDFRFADLFKGMMPWLILTLVGLFGGYMLFGWLMTSKCPKCKKRKLSITGKSYDNPQDYNPDILGIPDIRWDEVYHYKCSACGFEKDDRYSGFMSWWRSRQ